MYNKTTEDVTVTVEPVFLKEGSRPGEDMYLWAYRVRIENNRPESVHLRRSYWCITDSLGQVQEVTGIGVLLILSLAVYEYASGTILAAPSGMMMGSHEMEAENHKIIQVQVPPFSLDSPYEKISAN